MRVIDDDGNLFGVVNVVDALAVLLLFAVVAAGTALVLNMSESGGEDELGPPETRYATLDLGQEPAYVGDLIEEGDTISFGENENMTVTDVYSTDEGGNRRILIRVRLTSPAVDLRPFTFDGRLPQVGRTLDIVTSEYNTSGVITSVSPSGSSLDLSERSVIIEGTISVEEADRLSRNETVVRSNTTIATIEEFQLYEADNPNQRRVIAKVTLLTRERGEQSRFGSTPVRLGESVTLNTESVSLTGAIRQIDVETLPVSERDVLVRTTMSTQAANRVSVGDEYRVSGTKQAEIRSVTTYETGNPNRRLVYLGVSYVTYEPRTRPLFAGSVVREGASLPFRTSDYEFGGEVLRVGMSELPTAQRDVLIRTGMNAEDANDLTVGDEYRVNGETVGTIQSVDAYATGNPDRRLVYVGVTYRTNELRTVPQFAGTNVREGASLPFRTESYEFSGSVVRTGALEQRGEESTRTVELVIEEASPDVANALSAGMRERVRGETIASISSVSVEPAQIVLTSEGGNVYLREHPVLKEVSITAELQVRESATGVTFKGETLRPGDTIVIDLGTITIRATVTEI